MGRVRASPVIPGKKVHPLPSAKGTTVSQAAIRKLVRQIVEKFHPQRVVLFGSHAYGRPSRQSDVDLLVVMETPLNTLEQAYRICRSLDYHFGLDLIVRTPRQLAERIQLGDFFLREVMEKGKVLYERLD